MRVIVKAYGKINLFLDCLKKRDDGYHEVKMIMQSVRLHDFVAIDQNALDSINFYGSHSCCIPISAKKHLN